MEKIESKKRLLIISYSYPPNNVPGAQRPYALAKYIDKKKIDVKVITCSNPDLPLGVNEGFDSELENVELIKIKSRLGNSVSMALRKTTDSENKRSTILSKVKSFLFNLGQKAMFPDKGMFWSPNVKRYLKNNYELIADTDFVFSSSPGLTAHVLAKYVKQKNNKIRWVADFRDFHYVGNMQYKNGCRVSMHKKLEANILKEASSITFVTKSMQMAYKNFYPKFAYKMHAVYNGLEKSDFNYLLESDKRMDISKITIFYAGTFYNGLRSPVPLLQMIDRAIDENLLLSSKQINIQIAGNIDDNTINEMRGYKSFECVEFLGNLPRTEVLKFMTDATFNWLIVANIKSHYQTVPIKLFEYVAARRPIINFAPDVSEPTQIILNNNLGFSFNTLDFDLEKSYLIFKEIVIKFHNGEFSMPLSRENLDAFIWENQINMIENLMK